MLVFLVILALLAGGFFLLRQVYDRYWSRGLSVEVRFREEYAVEGELSALTETVTNRKLLPLPAVEIDFHMDRRLRFTDSGNTAVSDRSYRRDVFSLSFRQRITRTLEFRCEGRGCFQIDRTGLTARDLFFTRKYVGSLEQSTGFFVLPRPVPTQLINIPYSRVMGELLSRRKLYDDPFAFAGLREYTRGDPMKTINWKASARTGELLTNIHESTLSQRVTLLLDVSDQGGQYADSLTESAVRIACSLAERLLRAGVVLSVLSNGRDVLTDKPWRLEELSGAGGVLAMRKRFACLERERDLDSLFAAYAGLEPDSRTVEAEIPVFVSCSHREEAFAGFAQLLGRRRGIAVVPYKFDRPETTAYPNVDTVWLEV